MKKSPSRVEKVLNTWAIVLIVWSLYRWHFGTMLPLWFDELVAKPIVFLIPVIIFIQRVEKRKFFSSTGLTSWNFIKEALLGLLLGSVFFIMAIIGGEIKEKVFFNVAFLPLLGIALATSISEEILSRGFVLQRLYEESKNIFTASFFTSVLYFFLHIPILFTMNNITGTLLMKVMLVDIVLSLAVSFLFLARRSLVAPIIIHALYALSIYLFI